MSLVRLLLFIETDYGFWIPESEITGDALRNVPRSPTRLPGCSMRVNPQLNGSDYLMLGFDYELRRRGFAGNSCQIVLELNFVISPDVKGVLRI